MRALGRIVADCLSIERKRRMASGEAQNADIMEVHVTVFGQGMELKRRRAREWRLQLE